MKNPQPYPKKQSLLNTFFLLLVFVFTIQIQATNPILKNGIVTGKIIDAKTKESVAYVSIVIKDTANKIITGTITDENGNFKVAKIPDGNYILEVQFMGYKTVSKTFTITAKKTKVNLGNISFEEDTQSLDEIEIRAEVSTTIQKVDRKVINVGKDLVSAGATASEIMNNIPSVSVDQDGNVSLRGNTNVRVLVDGKPTTISAAQLLKQIPSSSIKSVELITNPSAKYNPEGMSGMINIVLKKNANMGFNGNLNTGITFGKTPKFNGSLNLNYKTGKINIFGNYGYNKGKWNNHGFVNRSDNNSQQNFIFNSHNESQIIKVGFDYYINKKNTFSFYTNQNIFNGVNDGQSDIISTSSSASNFLQKTNTNNDNSSATYNVDYKLDFEKKGHNIEFEVNYSIGKPTEDAVYKEFIDVSNPVFNYTDAIDNKRKNTIIHIDYVNPLSDKTKLELGVETRLRRTDNTKITTQNGIDINDNLFELPDTFYEYDQDINSLYATYSKKYEKLSVQVGARLESFKVTASLDNTKIFENDYITVYPSAFFTYNPSDKNQYQLSYSRRVDRPSLNQVNPIREWSTPQITSVGNPELRPQFTNSIELNYTKQLKKGSLTVGTFYRHITDNINRSIRVDPLDVNKVILSHINTDDNNAFGLELSSNYRFTKWWSVNTSFDVYSQNEEGPVNGEIVKVTNTGYNFRASNNFKATKKLRFSLFGMYRAPNKSLQFDSNAMWKIDVGARLTILKGKGSLSARYSDIFNSMHYGFTSERPFAQVGNFYWESQTAYLGFNYRFGGGKNKARSRKRRDNHEKSGGGGF